MGYRTVVVLFNDQASEWEHDPKLGKKIAFGMNRIGHSDADLPYGRVVECEHADTQTLAVVDGYNFTSVVHDSWTRNEDYKTIPLKLIKAAAKKLGYRLVRDSNLST